MVCCLQANAAKRGDINGDNNVDVSDINIVINEILGIGGTYNADVNGDGTTDVSDLNIVINIILGMDEPEDNHEYVDLGLPSGTLWATCNVGATKPEECGRYFAWGDTIGYAKDESHNFYWPDYKWCKGTPTTMTKYCTSSGYGTVDKKTVLDPEDDAATANWGKDWCMPTKAQQDELRSKCTWTWTTVNGVNGYKVVGSNGNSIFLPTAGYSLRTSLIYEDSYGYYWSRELYASRSDYAYYLTFFSDFIGWGNYYRCNGQSVRAVRVKAK